jgi:poly(A) polymerase
MGEGWRRVSPVYGEKAAKALLYRLRPQNFTDHVLLGWARSDATSNDAEWRALATLPQRWTAPMFPLKAADFMKRGVPQGPTLGVAIAAAEQAWVAAGFPSDQAALDAITGDAVHAPKPRA